MIFQKKVMFLGMETRQKKDGGSYTLIKILDKDSNEDISLFSAKPEKYREFKPYNDYDFNFNLNKQYDKELKQYIFKLNLNEV